MRGFDMLKHHVEQMRSERKAHLETSMEQRLLAAGLDSFLDLGARFPDLPRIGRVVVIA
jgi:hypothetical protein